MNRLLYLPLAIFLTSAISAKAADRVALVIGNGAYEHGNKLANPVNDATDIATSLRACGFTLVGDGPATDLGYESLSSKVAQFKKASADAKVALFFFAGHGMEVDGSNYLMPVDAKIEEKFQVKHRTLALDEVLESMAGEDKLKIVILDSCRNNPVARSWGRSASGGLAAPASTPGGTVLLFATAPGRTAEDGKGRNSPFSAVLKEAVKTPGADLEAVFKSVGATVRQNTGSQEPWMNSSYYGRFAFVPAKPGATTPADAVEPTPQRQFMVVKVDGKERKALLIPGKDLAKLRDVVTGIKDVTRVFRLDLTDRDVGKKIQGIEFEARNRLGSMTVVYQRDMGYLSARRTDSSNSNWRAASASAGDLFEIPQAYINPNTAFEKGRFARRVRCDGCL